MGAWGDDEKYLVKVPVQDVLAVIGNGRHAEFSGAVVHVDTDTLKCFKKNGTRCAICGIEGRYFWVERGDPKGTIRLVLYAVRGKGQEIMLTKDHIVPKAWGGKDVMSNYRTLCETCNQQLGRYYQILAELIGKTAKREGFKGSGQALLEIVSALAVQGLKRIEVAVKAIVTVTQD